MVAGRHYSARYVLNALRRRWALIAVPFLLTASVAGFLARTLPDVYYAEGTVTIARQQIPDSYVRTTVIVPFAERLRKTPPVDDGRVPLEDRRPPTQEPDECVSHEAMAEKRDSSSAAIVLSSAKCRA